MIEYAIIYGVGVLTTLALVVLLIWLGLVIGVDAPDGGYPALLKFAVCLSLFSWAAYFLIAVVILFPDTAGRVIEKLEARFTKGEINVD